MNIEEYLETLPNNLLSGEDVKLSERSLRDIFKFAELSSDDVFYHLGCSDGAGIWMAINEFKVKLAVGVDINSEKIKDAKKELGEKNSKAKLICQNITESYISDATVILFLVYRRRYYRTNAEKV